MTVIKMGFTMPASILDGLNDPAAALTRLSWYGKIFINKKEVILWLFQKTFYGAAR